MKKSVYYPKSPRGENSVLAMELNQPLRSKIRLPGEVIPASKFRSTTTRINSPRFPATHNSVNIKPPPTDTRSFISLSKGQKLKNPRRSLRSVRGTRGLVCSYENFNSTDNFDIIEDLSPSQPMEEVQKHYQRLRESQLDKWIETYRPSPVRILEKIAQISDPHASIIERILTELESLGPLYEKKNEDGNEEEERESKQKTDDAVFNDDPQKYFSASIAEIDKRIHGDDSMTAGTDELIYANTNIQTVDMISQYRLETHDLLQEKIELDREIANLKQELAEVRYYNKMANKDHKAYSLLFSTQKFDKYEEEQKEKEKAESEAEKEDDLDILLRRLEGDEKVSDGEDESDSEGEEKKEEKLTTEQKQNRIFHILFADQSHLKEECKIYSGRISQHRTDQLEIDERSAKRKFDAKHAKKKK